MALVHILFRGHEGKTISLQMTEMYPPVTLSPAFALLNANVQLKSTSAPAAASSVKEEAFASTLFFLAERDRAASPPSLNTYVPARSVVRYAVMLALLVSIFLLLRCIYHISPTYASKGTKARRISDHAGNNPCQPMQQQEQRRQHQGFAGAVAAASGASASTSSVEGEASSSPPTPFIPAGYSPATHLHLIDLHALSTSMHAWMLQVDLAETRLGESGSVEGPGLEDLLCKGVEILKDLQAITFSDEVNISERHTFMSTLGQFTQLARRLFEQLEGRLAAACKTQTGLLKSGLESASVHAQRAIDRHLIYPQDPAVQTFIGLRKAVIAAKEVYAVAGGCYCALFGISALGDSLRNLSAVLTAVERTLQQTADTWADIWIQHLAALHQRWQAGGGDGSRQILADIMPNAEGILEKLLLISGRTRSQ